VPDLDVQFTVVCDLDDLPDEFFSAIAELLLSANSADEQFANKREPTSERRWNPSATKTRRATAGQRPPCICISDPEKENACVHSIPSPSHMGIADRT
jgi:hypothetical protein